MPSNNESYYNISLPSGESYRWNEEQYAQAADKLYQKYPDAQVSHVAIATPGGQVGDNDLFSISLADGSSYQWDASQYRQAGEKLRQKYPDAVVTQVSDASYNYWAPKQAAAKQSIQDFDAQNGEFLKEFKFNREMAGRLEGENVLSSPHHDFVAQNQARYDLLQEEREGLRKQYYTNPITMRQYEQGAEEAARLKDAYDYQASQAATGSERRDWQRAAKLQDDIRKIYEAPGRYDLESADNGFKEYLKQYGQGAIDTFSDKDFYTFGVTKISRNFDLRGIAKKIENAGEDITAEDIDRILTPSEKAEIISFYTLSEAERERAMDELGDTVGEISTAYRAGGTSAESIKFMAEFLVSQGLANAAGKAMAGSSNAVAQWLGRQLMSENAINKAIQAGMDIAGPATKAGKALEMVVTKPLIQGLWHTATQLSSLEGISEGLMQTNNNGDLVSVGHAVGEKLLDSVVENWSESFGGAIEEGMALPFKGLGWVGEHTIGNTSFGRWARWMYNAAPTQVLKDAGFNGMIGEMAEEWAGNAVRVGLGLMSKDEFKDFASWEQQAEMAASFAPMSLFGLGTATASAVRRSRELDELSGKVQDIMTRQGRSQAEIEDLFNTRFDTAEDIGKKLAPYLKGISEKALEHGATEQDKEDYRTVIDFARALAVDSLGEELDRLYQQDRRDAMSTNISQSVGRFWNEEDVTDNDGNVTGTNRTVRTVTGTDGVTYFVVAAGEDGSVAGVSTEDGRKVTLRADQIQEGTDTTVGMDQYLDDRIAQLDAEEEAARMGEEYRSQVNAVADAVRANPVIPVGTPEAPVNATVVGQEADGVVVTYNDGQSDVTRKMSWSEAGAALGMPIEVKTDDELEQDAAAAYDQARARLSSYRGIIPGTEMAVAIPTADGEEIVNYKFQKAVMDDGQIIFYGQDESGQTKDFTEEMVTNIPDMMASSQNAAEAAEAPVEPAATPAVDKYTDETGKVSQNAFLAQEPEEWAKWNDQRNQDGGADTMETLTAAVTSLDAQLQELATRRQAESRPDEKEAIKQEMSQLQQRRDRLADIMAGYQAPVEEAQPVATPQQEAEQPTEQPVAEQTPAAPITYRQSVINSAEERIGEINARMKSGVRSSRRAELMKSRATAIKSLLNRLGMKNAIVTTRAEIMDEYRRRGATEDNLLKLQRTLVMTAATGQRMRGFFSRGYVYILADDIASAMDAVTAFSHEDKHMQNARTGAPAASLDTGVTADEMKAALVSLTRSHMYDNAGEEELADEVIANAAEIAEKDGVGAIPEKLRDAGIKNEEFITFVTKEIINGGQQVYRHLSEAGGDALLDERDGGRSGQDERNSVTAGGGLDRQGSGSDGEGGEGTGDTEVETPDENGVTPSQKREIAAAVGGELEGGIPTRLSVVGNAEGVGLTAVKSNSNGDVVFVGPDGREFTGRDTITAAYLRSIPNTVMGYMMADARKVGTVTARTENIIWQKYADLLNAYLVKGLAENGGFDNISSQWQWIAETVYKTVAPNSDDQYSYSLDITRVCKKNEAVIKTIAETQRRLGYGITPGQIMDIYLASEREGYQVPCPVCYVFSRYIRNGQYATIMINGQRKYGDQLVDPSTLTPEEKEERIRYWKRELAKQRKAAKDNKKAIASAKADIQTILDTMDTLGRDIMDGKIQGPALEEAMARIYDLDERYKAALQVVSQAGLEGWITNFAIHEVNGKWELYDDSYQGFPDRMALDLRETATVLREYPAIQRYRNSRGAAAGKEITFEANNDLGEVPMMLGVSKSELKNAPNYYKLAAEAKDEATRQAMLKKASDRFMDAHIYAQRQSLRGGQRMWSWSDNIERLSPDVFVNLLQMQMLGGALQSYSKQLEGINLVARMGGYVNGSLMGKGIGYREVPESEVERDGDSLYVRDGDFLAVDQNGNAMTIKAPVYEYKGKYYTLEFDDVVGIDAFGKDEDGKHLKGLFELNRSLDKAGNILVGMNDIHVRTAMADNRVFFIIPWHASGGSVHLLRQMLSYLGVNLDNFDPKDYTDVQEEKFVTKVSPYLAEFWEAHRNETDFACGIEGGIPSGENGELSPQQKHYIELRDAILVGYKADTGKRDKDGKPKYRTAPVEENEEWMREIMADKFLSQAYRKIRENVDVQSMTSTDTGFIYPYEYWDESSTFDTADVNGARYLEYCRRLGRKPKFCGKLDGKPESDFGNFADDRGYWKVLIDRSMYDTHGRFQDLTPVNIENFTPDLVDPEKTALEFKVTRVADDNAAKVVADRVLEREAGRPGGIANVNYDSTLGKAVKDYEKVLAKKGTRKLTDAEREAIRRYTGQLSEDFRASVVSDEESQRLFDAAKNLFGTTRDIKEAGYILPDGTMLDFSGKHLLDPKADSSFLRGRRTQDHREIASLAYEKDGNTPTGIETDMPDFIRRGAIRIDGSSGSIDLAVKPTFEQQSVLRRIVDANNGDVYVDFGDGWNTDHSAEYERARADRVINDIRRYFDEGYKPEGNAMFSIVGPEQDAEYMDAVNRGDMDAAQEMVDRAAEAAGYTIRGYHGTTHDFFVFDRNQGNPEGNWGKGFYFTTSEYDADVNYGNENGPDLRNRVELLAEQMEWMDGYEDMDYEQRLAEAEKILVGDNPHVISAAIRMENPLIIDPHYHSDETFFDFNNGYNPETDEYEGEESGLMVDFFDAWRDELNNWGWEGNNPATEELWEYAEDGLTASQLESKAREILDNANIMDSEGNLASGEFLRAVFERMGFDGIVDRGVNLKFGTQRKYGRSMDGVDYGTDHIIAFRPGQIKQTDPVTRDNEGNVIPLSQRFNPENEDIRFSVTSERDAEYMSAAERGDSKTAKRLADAAAKEAGYTVAAFHGTTAQFNSFRYNPDDIGFHFGDKKTARFRVGKGRGTSVMPVYLKMENTLDFNEDLGSWDGVSIARYLVENNLMSEEDAREIIMTPGGYRRDTREQTRLMRNWLISQGYDSLSYPNWYEGDGARSYAILRRQDIKSAEPITRDGNGNIIPLSQRFNPENEDIRYSVRGDEAPTTSDVLDLLDTRERREARRTEEERRAYMNEAEKEEDQVRYSVVTDQALIAQLESGPTVPRFQAAQRVDGQIYPPMAAMVEGKLVEPTRMESWLQSDERPELAVPDVYKRGPKKGQQKTYKDGTPKYVFKLDKGFKDARGKKTDINAAYNPYNHTSDTPLNDQFSSAWARPDLIVMEVAVPESELTSGYRAEKAKNAVGDLDWKNGPVANALAAAGKPARKVTLTRYVKPMRVVEPDEIADWAVKAFEGVDVEIPFNTVWPSLREALVARGIKIGEPEKGNAGDAARPAYEEWLKEQNNNGPKGGRKAPTSEDDFTADDIIRYSFIGEKGAGNIDMSDKTSNRLAGLGIAEQMESENADPLKIKMATGWERGADGKWRYEMDDLGLDILALAAFRKGTSRKLSEVVTDDRGLFTAYPELADFTVYGMDGRSSSWGLTDNEKRTIGLNVTDMKKYVDLGGSIAETMAHEVQHVIQRIEGFVDGMYSSVTYNTPSIANAIKGHPVLESWLHLFHGVPATSLKKAGKMGILKQLISVQAHPERYKNIVETDRMKYVDHLRDVVERMDMFSFDNLVDYGVSVWNSARKEAEDLYHRNAGEVEARNVEERLGMTDEERRNSLASYTEDVPRERQIIRFSISEKPERASAEDKVVKSDNFKNWFGDWENDPENASKIVDENGRPAVVYHGSAWNPLEEAPGEAVFNDSYRGTASGDNGFFGPGFYFTYGNGELSRAEAKYYGPNVTEAYLNIRNPFMFNETLFEYNGARNAGDEKNSALLVNMVKNFPELADGLFLETYNGNGEMDGEIAIEDYVPLFEDIYKNKEFIVNENVDPTDSNIIEVCADPVTHRETINGRELEWSDYGFRIQMYRPGKNEDARLAFAHYYLTDRQDVGREDHRETIFSIPSNLFNGIFESERFTDALKSKGYDGVMQSAHGDEVVAFYPNQIKSVDGKDFSRENDDIRFSITAEQDAEYMKAVEDGDMEKAGRMVRDAFKAAFPNTKVVDENGDPLVVYHGTHVFNIHHPIEAKNGMPFTVFFEDSHFGNRTQAEEMEELRRGDEESTRRAFERMGRPSDFPEGVSHIYPVFLNIEKIKRVEDQGEKDWGYFVIDDAKYDGYDGLIYSNEHESSGDSYVAFYPNQVKSAEPVTYDDNGNVIPLSQRFNPENDDIRWSIANQNEETFFSNAERSLDAIKQEKATPEQWLKMIEKNGGLKAGEDKWIGLSDWLKSKDRPVSFDDYWDRTSVKWESVPVENLPQYYAPDRAQFEHDGSFDRAGYQRRENYLWREYLSRREAAINASWQKLKSQGEHHYSPYRSSKSEYIIDRENGIVYRLSDHWGDVGRCSWPVDSETGSKELTIAKAKITDFKRLPLSKQEIADYIRQNKIRIEEVNYAENAEKDYADAITSYQDEYAELVEKAKGNNKKAPYAFAYDEMADLYGERFYEAFEQNGETIVPSTVWAGDDSLSSDAIYFLDLRREGTAKGINPTRIDYTTEGLTDKREIALTVPTIDPYNQYDDIHFGDAGEGRAIAWARFGEAFTGKNAGMLQGTIEYVGEKAKDSATRKAITGVLMNWNGKERVMRDVKPEDQFRKAKSMFEDALNNNMPSYSEEQQKTARETLAALENLKAEDFAPMKNEGGRVLVIDEIQSKRHQDAREEGGYIDPALDKRLMDATDAYGHFEIQMRVKYGYDENGDMPVGRMTPEEINRWGEVSRELKRARAERDEKQGRIPAAPFEKNWHELAMKRMLRLAAEEGFDYVAWTTGEQQAERYSLSKYINLVELVEDNGDTRKYELSGKGRTISLTVDGNGTVIDNSETGLGGEPLSEYVGKETAEKMSALTLSDDENTSLLDVDQAVGGEGMKGFYDDILPRFMNKYGKKWGVKVEDIELPNIGDGGLTMHSVRVTPEMKESVMHGQPMFSIKGDAARDAVERVDADGLSSIIGEEGARDLIRDAYRSLPENVRSGIVDGAMADRLNIDDHTREYLRDLADNGTENDETGLLFSLYDRIRMESGIEDLTDGDIRYMIWREAYGPISGSDMVGLAQDLARKRRWTGEQRYSVVGEKDTRTNANDSRADVSSAVDAASSELESAKKDLGQLQKIAKAMGAQKQYDKETVKAVADLAKEMMKDAGMNALGRREVGRLMGIIKTSVGKSPRLVKRNADRLVDMVIDHLIKGEQDKLDRLMKKTGKKVNATGVEVQGELDVQGQKMMAAFKKGIAMDLGTVDDSEDMNTLYGRRAALQDQLESEDDAMRREAEAVDAGLALAIDYKETVNEITADIEKLVDYKGQLDNDFSAGRIGSDEYRQNMEAADEAIRDNRITQLEAMRDFVAKISGSLAESIDARKAFTEREKERVEHIHHMANSDLEGVSNDIDNEKPPRGSGWANGVLARFFFAPLATFDQMLRLFGRKSVNGEGYLYSWYMRKWQDATGNAYQGTRDAFNELDRKASSVFGKKMRWSDIYEIERRLPKAEVSWKNAKGEMVKHELTQGQLLYIYMVNKMSDGRMKLRRMGIMEQHVAAIARELDPRFIELADWMQDEYLVEKRNKYNEVHERLFGASMAAIENYFPLKINKRSLNKQEDLGTDAGFDPMPSTSTGSIIKRRVNTQPLDILNADAFSVMIEHIEQMEQWAAFAEFNKDINSLISYKNFRNKVQNMATVYGAGTTLWKNFKDVAKIATGSFRPSADATGVDRAAMNIAKGVTGAKISFRIFTALKQFLSMPAFLADANPAYLAKNMATPWEAWNWAMDNLPIFEKRWKSRMAGDTRLMKTDSDWKLFHTKMVEKLSRWGMSPNAFVDALTVSIGARSVYETKKARYIKEGFSEEEADRKAKQDATTVYNQSQQSNESAYVSRVQLDRTFFSSAVTVFRNSAMGFQRQVHSALRGYARMMKPGYREQSIEFTAKQLVREGLSEEQAREAATRRYNHAYWQNAVRIGVFGFLVQFCWNLGSSIAYLLFGDDDDEKKAMIDEAAIHALVGGWNEGLTGGSLISEMLNMVAHGESLRNYDPTLMPLISDIKRTAQMMDYDPVAGANELVNLAVQSGIGVNPQTLTDAVVAVIDACDGDPVLSQEALILTMRVLQVPQSQVDKIYIDELGMSAKRARTLSAAQMAKRYAEYKTMKGAPVTGWAYDDALRKKRDKAYRTKFENAVKARKELKKGNKK